jgi:hypothetical protein
MAKSWAELWVGMMRMLEEQGLQGKGRIMGNIRDFYSHQKH